MTERPAPLAPAPPSTRWYRLSAALLVLGALGAFAWFNYAMVVQTDAVNAHQPVPIHRGASVEVAEGGRYTVWAGTGCMGMCRPKAGEVYRRHTTIAFETDDGAVALTDFPGERYFNVGAGREGRAVWLVDFEQAGVYRVHWTSDGEVPSPSVWLGRGEGLPARIVAGVVTIAGTAVAAAALVSLVVAVRRRRALTLAYPIDPSRFEPRGLAARGRRFLRWRPTGAQTSRGPGQNGQGHRGNGRSAPSP